MCDAGSKSARSFIKPAPGEETSSSRFASPTRVTRRSAAGESLQSAGAPSREEGEEEDLGLDKIKFGYKCVEY